RHDPHREIEAEDPRPEAGDLVVALVPSEYGLDLEDQDDQGQSHGQLGEKIVVRDREAELDAMPQESVGHRGYSAGRRVDHPPRTGAALAAPCRPLSRSWIAWGISMMSEQADGQDPRGG